jgi:hypothetical protein
MAWHCFLSATLGSCAAQHGCRDPTVTLVGFGWDSSDERKMRRTFGPGCGRASFGAFCDLQVRTATGSTHILQGLLQLFWPCCSADIVCFMRAREHTCRLGPVLQTLAAQLGYKQPGLARTTAAVLGAVLPKPKAVSMSNWQAPQLTAKQIQYAALDALLAGHAFRGLRCGSAEPFYIVPLFIVSVLPSRTSPSGSCFVQVE